VSGRADREFDAEVAEHLRLLADHYLRHPLLDASLDDIRALPGVSAAGIGKPLPLSGAQQATVFTPDGELPVLLPGALSPIAQFTVGSPHMLRALGATLIAGRDFSAADRTDSLPVVIVNEARARSCGSSYVRASTWAPRAWRQDSR
jgi:putative ABC transport system permease protein